MIRKNRNQIPNHIQTAKQTGNDHIQHTDQHFGEEQTGNNKMKGSELI